MTAYKRRRYLLMTTDPVHIGTGGYRLGRVDNSIVREPGTRVPKIPGTSLHGAIRSYAARLYGTPEAAGQSHDKVEKPEENPVCYTFGYTKKEKKGDDEKTTAYSGVVNIFDAHVLLFPVPSMVGPVWVSTLRRLKEAGFSIQKDGIEVLEEPKQGDVLLTWERDESLNLGWLMVNVAGKVTVAAPKEWEETERWKAVCERLVLVGESLFSHIVNSNLEVRTSVAIDPKQGAAEEGALFTYEAIPRATFLTAEIVLDDYRNAFPRQETNAECEPSPGGQWKDPLCVVDAGLQLIEWLGIGGMGTRGFGRMAIVGNPIDEEYHNN